MRKMLLIAAAAALLAPVAAFADKPPTKPPHPSQAQNGSKPAPKVLYVLRGTLSAYTAASGSTPGSITIAVTSANHHGKSLKGMILPFTSEVLSSTKVVLHKHAAINDGDRGIVKVRFPKTFDPTNANELAAFKTTAVKQIIDQGKHANSGQGQNNSHSSTWLYVLHGTVTAVDNPTTPATITFSVTSANHFGKTVLKDGTSLTLKIGTKVVFANGASSPIGTNDRVIVKVSGPKNLTDVSHLADTAKQIIDQGH